MKLVSVARAVTTIVAALALSSCQYGYDIRVIVRDGRIAFELGTGGRIPRVNLFQVDEIGRRTRAVWRLETTRANGPELRDLRYGSIPTSFKETIHAQPLDVGRVYRVGLFAVDGVGSQSFAISDSGEILKVSDD